MKQKQLGPEHPDLTSVLNTLGNALSHLGHHEEAMAHLARSQALAEKAMGPHHPYVAMPLTVLASELTRLGRYDEARQRLDRAMAILEKAYGREHPDVSYALSAQGDLLLARGKPAEAVALLERAVKLAPQGSIHAEVRFRLARALWEARPSERSRAVSLATEARDTWQRLGHSTSAAKSEQWLAERSAPASASSELK
jgi:serine/threonine-protein kinase